MRKYVPLQPQRDEIASLMKAVNDCRKRALCLIESDNNNVASLQSLENAENELMSCLSDLGDVIGFTIYSDIVEGEEVKL